VMARLKAWPVTSSPSVTSSTLFMSMLAWGTVSGCNSTTSQVSLCRWSGCCAVWPRRNLPTFRRCLQPHQQSDEAGPGDGSSTKLKRRQISTKPHGATYIRTINLHTRRHENLKSHRVSKGCYNGSFIILVAYTYSVAGCILHCQTYLTRMTFQELALLLSSCHWLPSYIYLIHYYLWWLASNPGRFEYYVTTVNSCNSNYSPVSMTTNYVQTERPPFSTLIYRLGDEQYALWRRSLAPSTLLLLLLVAAAAAAVVVVVSPSSSTPHKFMWNTYDSNSLNHSNNSPLAIRHCRLLILLHKTLQSK
jgi:hypothetical protein